MFRIFAFNFFYIITIMQLKNKKIFSHEKKFLIMNKINLQKAYIKLVYIQKDYNL